LKGTVKWFNSMKGFGFIEPEEGKDVYVHQSALAEGTELNEGDKVEFEIEDSPRGPKAKNVKKLDENITDEQTREEEKSEVAETTETAEEETPETSKGD